MLLFQTSNGEFNFIHIIIGQESDLQLALNGSLDVPISEVIAAFKDPSLPTIMRITNPESEEYTRELLEQDLAEEKTEGCDCPSCESKKSEKGKEQTHTQPNDSRGIFTTDFLCPKCGSKGVFLKKDSPPLCADCIKIENGLHEKLMQKASSIIKSKLENNQIKPDLKSKTKGK